MDLARYAIATGVTSLFGCGSTTTHGAACAPGTSLFGDACVGDSEDASTVDSTNADGAAKIDDAADTFSTDVLATGCPGVDADCSTMCGGPNSACSTVDCRQARGAWTTIEFTGSTKTYRMRTPANPGWNKDCVTECGGPMNVAFQMSVAIKYAPGKIIRARVLDEKAGYSLWYQRCRDPWKWCAIVHNPTSEPLTQKFVVGSVKPDAASTEIVIEEVAPDATCP